MNLWTSSVDDLIGALKTNSLARAYVVTDPRSGRIAASHDILAGVADAIAADTRDYRRHQGCFFEIGRESDHLLSAHIHWTRRGQAAGGVRFWSYDTVESYVRDGLRLSLGMGQKCALAGLWWGGGKGVIARRAGQDHLDPDVRGRVYRDYGRFLTGLAGCYIAAEDVGTTPEDMAMIFTQTRYTTCIPERMGGSGNPSRLTARGVVVAMEAALDHLGRGALKGKTVALQGLGHVSFFMISELSQRGVKRIVGSDIDARAVARIRDAYPDAPLELRVDAPGDMSILAEGCDVVVPNAVGATLNPRTIPSIRAPIVCGAANNQLEDPDRDAMALRERDVLFVPDFLANRMGIVNCANEQYGVFDGDPAIERHLDRATPFGIYRRALEVFEAADASGRTPAGEAETLAEELSRELHPVWGNRGQEIMDHLVASGWARSGPVEG